MFVLTAKKSIAHRYLAQLRSLQWQQDPWRFQHNLERLGELLAYELSQSLNYQPETVQTPLAPHAGYNLAEEPVLLPILRAGIPLYNGVKRVFDQAPTGFIGAMRGPHAADHSFQIDLSYTAAPSLEGRILILIDPMLATGASIVKAIKALESHGQPKEIHLISVIAAKPGVDFLQKQKPELQLWLGDVDPTLNEDSYIVPGLGDAGDLAFGPKI